MNRQHGNSDTIFHSAYGFLRQAVCSAVSVILVALLVFTLPAIPLRAASETAESAAMEAAQQAADMASQAALAKGLDPAEALKQAAQAAQTAYAAALQAQETGGADMKAADTDTAAADTAGTDADGQGTAASAAQAPADIVSLSGMYTYDQMTADLTKLAAAYPDSIRVSSIGATALGRKIPEVILGNPKAAHSIMIQSSMHAREYLATQMTMKMIEYYAQQYRSGGTWNGHSIRKLLNTVCLYIVPMSNPDGVSIAQSGKASVPAASTAIQSFISLFSGTTGWKANANGVDLNRNYPTGWTALTAVTVPSPEGYRGSTPASENETKAMMALAASRSYDAYVSYHMAGNIIYYDESGNTPQNSAQSALLAQTLRAVNGYGLRSLITALRTGECSQAGFNDWVQLAFGKPGVTVELGSSLPPYGQGQIGSIYGRNRDSWAAMAALYGG